MIEEVMQVVGRNLEEGLHIPVEVEAVVLQSPMEAILGVLHSQPPSC
jgi:hypothetical protein